ncbi:MAG: ATP-binding cassette domain-containing protein [Actinobacteria bacterium]|nr:ATP-binding cassette domain-containing protein [Actinomycetota bacterium]
MIELLGLEVEAGGFRVGPVGLRAGDGRYVVLLGPSGAGKSLVLEAAAGVRGAAAGRIRLAGADVTGLTPERRRVGLVFQDGLLFPHLTVAANIAYGMRAAGRDGVAAGGAAPRSRGHRLSARVREEKVRRLAATVGVTALLDRRPATLSGGERQRVALARALAAGPRALLLDEPLSAVDPEAREELQEVLRRICGERRLPVLHVTHDRDEAFALADECVVLIGGRVHQAGKPLEVLRRPADAAVARFLGARNVLPARRDPADPRLAVLDAGGALPTASPLPAEAVVVVVRPEDLRLAPAGDPAAATAATVTRLTLQGGHVLVGLAAPAPLDALVPAGELDAAGITVGQKVTVSVRPEHVHVLPAG